MSTKASKKLEQLSIQSRVLSEIRSYYDGTNSNDLSNGLLNISSKLKSYEKDNIESKNIYLSNRIIPPKQNITILLIGNHSAGKSSFINWYIDSQIQKESTAIETTAFTWVVSGKTRDTYIGGTTAKYLGYIDGIENFKGVLDNLYTEVVPSKANKFEFVDLIDSPGLADDLSYPYDIKSVLAWIADRVDLVFVFFDPHGQALCKKTKSVVAEIATRNHRKLHYILSKVDTVPTFSQLFRLGIQLAQSLTSLHQGSGLGVLHSHKQSLYKKDGDIELKTTEADVSYGEHAFKMYGIYLPSKKETKEITSTESYNDMQDLLDIIDKKKTELPQNSQIQFRADCQDLCGCVDNILDYHKETTHRNYQIWLARTSFLSIVCALPICYICYLLHALSAFAPVDIRKNVALSFIISILKVFASSRIAGDYQLLVLALFLFFMLLILSRVFLMFFKPVRKEEEINQIKGWKKYLNKLLEEKSGVVENLLDSYLQASSVAK